jgi:branched-chain amino acid transport system permease protein
LSAGFWVTQVLNALSLGALLFLVAAGLSLIFGVMRVVNLAHGSFYMLGTYVTFAFLHLLHNQLLATLLAGAVLCVLGAFLQHSLIERVRGDSLRQLLLTFGILLVIGDFTIFVWHGAPAILPTPKFLAGSVQIGGGSYPVYRLAVIAIGLVLALALDQLQTRTRLGAMIRAGADDIEMLSCMAINVRRLFVIVFALCAGLAGIGGAVGGVFLGVYPGVDLEIGVLAFVVVIVGGLGSIRGTLAASLLVGLIDNLSKALFPEISLFAIFLLMVVVIAIRPAGLFGKQSLA